MNKKTLVPLLGIAFVVAVLATGIFYGLFANRLRNGGGGSQIAVASRDLDRGKVLDSSDIRMESWPAQSLPAGAFTSADGVAGQTVLDPIHKGEPLLPARVASKDGGGGLGIPAGKRAVSIHLADHQGIAAMVKAGHRVDVQLISLPGETPELKTILQNVPVLRVDGPEGRQPPVVTLLLSPVESDEVALADAAARVRLTLRNPLDDGNGSLPRQTLPGLFQKNPGLPDRNTGVVPRSTRLSQNAAVAPAGR